MGGQYSRPPPAAVELKDEHEFDNLNDAEKKVVLDLIDTILAEVPKAIEHNDGDFMLFFPRWLKVSESVFFRLERSVRMSGLRIDVTGVDRANVDGKINLLHTITLKLKEYINRPFVIHTSGGDLWSGKYDTSDDSKNQIYGRPCFNGGVSKHGNYSCFYLAVMFVQTPT